MSKITLTDAQKEYLRENHKKIPDLIKLTQNTFLDESLDGRSKEGRAVKDFLVEENLDYNTTKKEKKGPVELTDEQKDEILDLAEDGLNSFQIAQIIFPEDEVKKLSTEQRTVMAYIKDVAPDLLQKDEKPRVREKYQPPSEFNRVLALISAHTGDDMNPEELGLVEKKSAEKMLLFLSAPRFLNTINNYRDKDDRDLFEAEFVRATWGKPDLTTDEINLYINVCIDYINLRNISRNIEKLNRMFNEADSQQEMTVRLAELLKTKSEEYDKCEKRMESLIKKLNGDRARRLENRQSQNASILSLVETFQNEKERAVMVRMAEMQKKLVKEEADRMESMDSWKARILGLSKDDAI